MINAKVVWRTVTVTYAFESLSLLYHFFLCVSAQLSPSAADYLVVLTKLQSFFFDLHQMSVAYSHLPASLWTTTFWIWEENEIKSSSRSSSPCLSSLVVIMVLSSLHFWKFILYGDRMMIYQSVWYQDGVIKAMAPRQYYINLLSPLAGNNRMVKHSSIHHTLSYYTKCS